jgi:ubiquinone/menaquinone biosynthesis C-methylase UbiE
MKALWVDLLQCPRCQADLTATAAQIVDDQILAGALDCHACGIHIPIINGGADLLLDPPAQVRNEVKGQIAQRAGDLPPDVARRRAKKYRTLNFNEFREANLEGALAQVALRPGMTTLDLGAGDGWILSAMAGYGPDYLGIDVLFPDDMDTLELGSFIKADMNKPPLKDGTCDLVITSAALHHSYDLPLAMGHIARILKPGGIFLAVSEPAKGILRNNDRFSHEAHPCLNENVYWVWEYLRLARQVGLNPRTFLPGYVSRRLDKRATRGLRFGGLGAIVAYFWQIGWIRRLLERYGYMPASLLFGMPLVMVARKGNGSVE